jgi:hypothetical protein
MTIMVTRNFLNCLKKQPHLRRKFEQKACEAIVNPSKLRKKKAKDIYSLDISYNFRALLAKDQDNRLIPFFIGSHDEYDEILGKNPKPENVLKHLVYVSLDVRHTFNKICRFMQQNRTWEGPQKDCDFGLN